MASHKESLGAVTLPGLVEAVTRTISGVLTLKNSGGSTGTVVVALQRYSDTKPIFTSFADLVWSGVMASQRLTLAPGDSQAVTLSKLFDSSVPVGYYYLRFEVVRDPEGDIIAATNISSLITVTSPASITITSVNWSVA